MFKQLFASPGTFKNRILLLVALFGCLIWLGLTFCPRPAPSDPAARPPQATWLTAAPRKLEGDSARVYLQQTGEGQSLMKALATARFGLERREESPFGGDTGAGYLGMSHDENLNAWFDNEGVTVRPTVNEQERAKAWRLRMSLKAYGYGSGLQEARKQTAPTVKENRIEYERNQDEASARVVEWYVNKSEGIEQGFTLDTRPQRGAGVPDGEDLRLIVSVAGGLRASASTDGQSVELSRNAAGVLSYSQLTAIDALGKKLAARMETNASGDEISLVVDDHEAQYPIVVDPITATLKQELSASIIQAEARFGFSVALDSNLAVVGAWREDIGIDPDQGAVYVFVRQTNWVFDGRLTPALSSSSAPQCGWSVAVHGSGFVVGCPGFSSSKGLAVHYLRTAPGFYPSSIVNPLAPSANGDRFGESVAIGLGSNSGWDIIVGSPFRDIPGKTDIGTVNFLQYNSSLALTNGLQISAPGSSPNNAQFGRSVAVANGRAVVGQKVGDVHVYERANPGNYHHLIALAGDIQPIPGDFGNRVAIRGNTVVVSDPLYDMSGGVDAGAVYVYDLTQIDPLVDYLTGQILTASDGRTGDLFGEHAVAVGDAGDTIVVGAYANGQGGDPINGIPDDDRGAAYVFTKSNGVWSQQAKISQGNFAGGEAGDHFGIDVDIAGNTVIIGARAASAGSTLRAGAAFIYELDCLPPLTGRIVAFTNLGTIESATACPGSPVVMHIIESSGESFQWRKDGVIVPGATTATFNISSMSANDVGVYDVIVTNACGTVMSRTGTLSIHSLDINPTSQNFSATGSTGIVNVSSSGSCGWTATSNASWISITSGASGTGNGTVGFNVAANTGAQRTGTMTIAGQTFTITQDGAAPTPTPTPTPAPNVVQFNSSNYSMQEDCTTVTITVNRIGDPSGAASVDYNTSDVTASERKDYITALGTLRFAGGETSKSFVVLINEDSLVEGNETLNVNLSNPAGVSLGGPAIATITITDDASEPAANPVDDAQNYVCQHYHDFLNRQPDAPGLAFWTNQIAACGSDQQCIEVRRINVSASFFLSIEFQDTGYLVERICKASYGDATGSSTFPSAHQLPVPVVRLNEFLSDTQEIGQGVIVGQGNWQQQLENNKQAFTASFVQRARFLTAFPTSMTAAQFVDALNANAGNPLSSAERNQLVSDLSTGARTRAQVLRAVAEDTDLNTAESNRAFVLMQYFGYLRRNPNDPQDTDHTGYDFWLTKLNQFSGNYINAEMVKAFITSIEYRNRFGP